MGSTQKFVLTLLIFVLIFSIVSIALNVYLLNVESSGKNTVQNEVYSSNSGNIGLTIETNPSSENYGK